MINLSKTLQSIPQFTKRFLIATLQLKMTSSTPTDILLVQNILTWPEYAKLFQKTAVDTDPKFQVDDAMNQKISLHRGDITKIASDAIVNASNTRLLGGGGVDGAIHKAAGSELLKECATLHGCNPGDAKITKGYLLPAKYVIHTVGPIGEQTELLKSCYKRSMDILMKNNLKSIVFPCISTGTYNYPNEEAAQVALNTIRNWLKTSDCNNQIERIVFCVFLDKDLEIYKQLLHEYFPLS